MNQTTRAELRALGLVCDRLELKVADMELRMQQAIKAYAAACEERARAGERRDALAGSAGTG